MSPDPEFLVQVAAPLPVDTLFTYRVPPALADRIAVGRRVLAPFRNTIRAGFIVSIYTSGPLPKSIKEVMDIPDEPPYFNASLWEFLKWAADYYMLPVGLLLKTALPRGADRKSSPWAILMPEGRKCLGERLPADFLRKGSAPLKDLKDSIGAKIAEEACAKGWIAVEERIARPRVTLKRQELPELIECGARPAEIERVTLTDEQRIAYLRVRDALEQGEYKPFLLHGVTGSGKTEVYIEAIRDALRLGRRALVLVPEIALTPQLARRFLRRLGAGIALYHSGLTPAQRTDEWRRIAAGRVNVVIAARSGVFVPLDKIGIIIVDEEHDPSYKQEDACPYHARDLALARGKLEGATVVLGSATPSFESWVNAQRGRFERLELTSRRHGGTLPPVRLVDLRKQDMFTSHRFLSPPLLQAMRETLARGEQVILFLNRRGFDTIVQCRACGRVFKCPNCDVTLIHHKGAEQLRCHLCGHSQPPPRMCPQCKGGDLFFGGFGGEKLEERLEELFPDARVARLDSDSTAKRGELERIIEGIRNRTIDILVGTQMIVKGHDFPGVSLVGVLWGDLSLHFPDFRAAERTFQMLTQAAGRTGRKTDSGRVLLQTFDPDHSALRHAAAHDYEGFFEEESELRKELAYPPYGHLALIRVEGTNEDLVEEAAVRIGRAARFSKSKSADVLILGPASAPRKKAVGKHRWRLLLKCASRPPLRALARSLKHEGYFKGGRVNITLDIDPVDML
jgi:primosomal protein N' (replication factor Y)